jgi:hypothetical protein
MSAELAHARYRRVGWTILTAAAITLVAWIAVTIDATRLQRPRAAGPVLPGFQRAAADASLILIQTKDATYRIARTDRGWALRDKGNYPVRRERLNQFTQGLAGLEYVRPMTRDPAKLDRLALGDPAKGGDGVAVQVQNAQGAFLANLVLGIEPRGIYVRDPTKEQTWAVKGDLPPLQDPAAWLDLAPIAIDKARLARVDVAPPSGPPFAVVREGAQARDFKLAKPFDRYLVLTPAGLNAVGESIAALSPVDVAGTPAIGGVVRARTVARTFDGLVIEGELYEDRGRRWLKLVARGETPQAVAEAQDINARAAPWAYGLSEMDFRDFAPPLALIARAPGAPLAAPSAAPTPPGVPPAAQTPPRVPPAAKPPPAP